MTKALGSADQLGHALAQLATTIDERASENDPSASYTAKLLSDGPDRTAKKLGEEGVEAALAIAKGDSAEISDESADLLYHLLVALRSQNVSLDDVANALVKRQGMSGLEEKAARKA